MVIFLGRQRFLDLLAHGNAAGGRDHIHLLMRHQGVANVAPADQDLQKIVLTIRRFVPSLAEFSATSLEKFATPKVTVETFQPAAGTAPGGEGHLAVHRDLREAILTGSKPRCDGRDALASLELANAMTLSSFTGRAVTLPLDRAAYTALLSDLRAGQVNMPG